LSVRLALVEDADSAFVPLAVEDAVPADIYDPAGRTRLAGIHADYMRMACQAGLPILTFAKSSAEER
jgi:hypothetical protein